MILNMNGGGSAGAGTGSGLNFKVVGGTSAPVSPAENTIWVDTDTEITSWAFSQTEPEVPSEGMVWILTGKISTVEFNALKKNDIQVYPLSATQYVDGAWVEKTATTYQDGVWVEWIPAGALYYFGNNCENNSGGWQARGWAMSSSNITTVVPTITNNDDHMQIDVPASGVACGAVEVLNDQDLTDVDSITIDYEMTVGTYYVQLVVIDRSAAYMDNAVGSVHLAVDADGEKVHSTTISRRTATLDTSGISGLYDVAIRFSDHWSGTSNSSVDMKVYSVIKE